MKKTKIKTEWVNAKELKTGDYIIVPDEINETDHNQIGRVQILKTILHNHRQIEINVFIHQTNQNRTVAYTHKTTDEPEKYERVIFDHMYDKRR